MIAKLSILMERVLLEPFDSDERELVLRWRLWKTRWFPYRTAEWKGFDEETDDLITGPWEWHRPRVLERKKR